MNIFFLDSDPQKAAQMMVDSHVVKMILESAQLLSTAHRVMDGNLETRVSESSGRKQKYYKLDDERELHLYSATHINHPCAVWVRTSVENYLWVYEHLHALLKEYTFRYGKKHKTGLSHGLMWSLSSPPFALKEFNFTTPPNAMDNKYIITDDPVINYQNYYRAGKKHLHKWKKRNPPKWIEE